MLQIGMEYYDFVHNKQKIVRTIVTFVHIMAVNDTIVVTLDFCS